MEVILICIAITIVALSTALYIHRSRQRAFLTKTLKVDEPLRERVAREMYYPHITKLYMYKPPNCYTLDILRKCHLWAAKPERFNDPFDCDLEIEKYITEEGFLKALYQGYGERDQWPSHIVQYVDSNFDADGKFMPEERDRVQIETQKFIQKTRNSGVLCLSEEYNSILMWSHYAENHKGVCFEFTRAEDNDLGDLELCSPVKYDRHYPIIDLGQLLLNQDGETLKIMMYTKSEAWAYEKEWRLITEEGDQECPLPGPISRVILGIKIEDPFKSNIETLCQERNIPCVQARMVDREFRIEVPSE